MTITCAHCGMTIWAIDPVLYLIMLNNHLEAEFVYDPSRNVSTDSR